MNVYYYRALTAGVTAQMVAQLFSDTIISQVVLIQTDRIAHTSVEVINLDDETDFFEDIFNPTFDGTIGTASLPSYASWTFRLVRSSRVVRNGRKAICGVAESATVDNEAAVSAIPELEDTANAFAALLDNNQGEQLEPVIYGAPTPPPSSLPLRVIAVQAGQYSHLSTQNTRKNLS